MDNQGKNRRDMFTDEQLAEMLRESRISATEFKSYRKEEIHDGTTEEKE